MSAVLCATRQTLNLFYMDSYICCDSSDSEELYWECDIYKLARDS
jgi:hypothetical protein